MSDLEKALYDALIAATKECKKLHYNPTLMLQMIHDSGPLGACQRLLAATTISDGFARLWELHRLDLTVENIVLQPRFAGLFTDEERLIARRRLEEYRFSPTELA
jgi:hypothetical protein